MFHVRSTLQSATNTANRKNFLSKNFCVRDFRIKIFSDEIVCPKMKNTDKFYTWGLATTWNIMEELRRELCIRGRQILKKYGIHQLERWCSARPSLKTRRIDIQLPLWKEELLNIFHEGYPDCVHSFCDKDVPAKTFHVFGFLDGSENIFTPKISRFTVQKLANYDNIIIYLKDENHF